MSIDIFKGYGIPILLKDEDSFLKIRETLTRIGVASRKEQTLWQSCHILHKQGYYHLMHFKELFLLDGRQSDFSENDIARRNTIALLLHDWELFEISPQIRTIISSKVVEMNQIKILSYKEKSDWDLQSKYSIGGRKFNTQNS